MSGYVGSTGIISHLRLRRRAPYCRWCHLAYCRLYFKYPLLYTDMGWQFLTFAGLRTTGRSLGICLRQAQGAVLQLAVSQFSYPSQRKNDSTPTSTNEWNYKIHMPGTQTKTVFNRCLVKHSFCMLAYYLVHHPIEAANHLSETG